MKTEKQLKALKQAQHIYIKASAEAFPNENFQRLSKYTEVLINSELRKGV